MFQWTFQYYHSPYKKGTRYGTEEGFLGQRGWSCDIPWLLAQKRQVEIHGIFRIGRASQVPGRFWWILDDFGHFLPNVTPLIHSASWAVFRAMEPGQPYQRDEALLEELGYKTGQKASDPDGRSRWWQGVKGMISPWFWISCLHSVALPKSQGLKIKDNQRPLDIFRGGRWREKPSWAAWRCISNVTCVKLGIAWLQLGFAGQFFSGRSGRWDATISCSWCCNYPCLGLKSVIASSKEKLEKSNSAEKW